MTKLLTFKAIAATAVLLVSSLAGATAISGAGTGLGSPASTLTFSEIVLADNTVFNSQYSALGIASASGLFFNGCQNLCVNAAPSGAHCTDIGEVGARKRRKSNRSSRANSFSCARALPRTVAKMAPRSRVRRRIMFRL